MEKGDALHKIKNWCAYQERSQYDVRQKLRGFGLKEEEVETMISDLIQENFLNEERFARAFASGKFRIKLWGKKKIRLELKKHRVSDYCINKALSEIDNAEYLASLVKVIEKKMRLTRGKENTKQYYAILNYVVSKGYESDLVIEQLNVLLKSK